MAPVRNVATELTAAELELLRAAVTQHTPELAYLLTDRAHQLTLEESDRLLEAISQELTLDGDDEQFQRGLAFDNLIDRVNLGPYLR